MGSSAAFPIVIPDDDEKQLPVEPVAAVPAAEDEQAATAAAAEGQEVDVYEHPGWLPDGFEVEGYYEDDGTFQPTDYICPVSGFKFCTKREVLDYCFSEGIERAQAGKNTLKDKTTLQGKYDWLRKPGWVLEIRAGGKDFSKMYKIIAQLEFYIPSLPPGWVKETAFRKCSDGIRKDVFYTDPITTKVFRSLKSAEQYFASGGEPLGAHVPTMTITKMYYFDRCTDMLPCLARRLKVEGTEDGQTSCMGEEDGKAEWHGDDEIEEAHFGDGKEGKDNEKALYGDGEEEEDEQEVLHGGVKQENNDEGMLVDDVEEDDKEPKIDRYRSVAELYQVTTQTAK